VAVALLGTYYACTEGIVVALASGMLPPELRASGLALLSTATSLSRLGASVVFGWIWTFWGRDTAVITFGVALIFGVILASGPLARSKRNPHG
jgi:hypothetical protein